MVFIHASKLPEYLPAKIYHICYKEKLQEMCSVCFSSSTMLPQGHDTYTKAHH